MNELPKREGWLFVCTANSADSASNPFRILISEINPAVSDIYSNLMHKLPRIRDLSNGGGGYPTLDRLGKAEIASSIQNVAQDLRLKGIG